jgi:hypothetical protein
MPHIYKPDDSDRYTPSSEPLRFYFSFCFECVCLFESSMLQFYVHIRPTEMHVAKMANIESSLSITNGYGLHSSYVKFLGNLFMRKSRNNPNLFSLGALNFF